MMFMETEAPLPLVKVNEKGNIQAWTREAARLFPDASELLELVDIESREKMERLLKKQSSVRGAEINMYSREGEVSLFSVFASPVAEGWEVAFVPLSRSYHRVAGKLMELQARLSETNFELYQKSEQLQKVLKRSNKLSGPFIELTPDLALLPIFGDLTLEKLTAIEKNVLKRSYHAQTERLLVDFTGVGEIRKDGVKEFCDLILTFRQMGMHVVMIGLHPSHARVLAPYRQELQLEFDHSARTAIEKWLHMNP